MNSILQQRLVQQQLAEPSGGTPATVATRLVGLQAQEYSQAQWALGVRLPGCSAQDVAQAFADGSVIRTWLFRGTLHLAAAADVQWLLTLLAPRILAGSRTRHQQLGLDEATLHRCRAVLEQALSRRQLLTRSDVSLALQQAGIPAQGPRLLHILQWASFNQVICQGPQQAKEPTFTLLDTWLPPTPLRSREEALAELTQRYFTGHGPATVTDFIWWSGLTAGDARRGLAAAAPGLQRQVIAGQEYWSAGAGPACAPALPFTYLLPGFDEYFLGYKNRELFIDPRYVSQVVSANGIFKPIIVVDGQVAGCWKHIYTAHAVWLETRFFTPELAQGATGLAAAAHRYSQFVQRPTHLA
ncbi:winged helix DNA-binding domain-containing protein [Hymenobacter guriensis]|uniref:AlkZ family DNA glycosylase n=1 Tax=Hymenobacter guriensis TaxID=2793065 RepID=A0ABS0L8S4_9BACT|nr:winged helix DNA-binding domain-containing protein [Hymenobacter guriensis]MBG8555958.1 AlkZ family DNA glycosylase [Hymenobacter guriensis]